MIVATVTIIFMTVFMLLEGPDWVERFYRLLPPEQEARWRAIGRDIYRTVGGYVSGNLVISLIAGLTSTAVLLIMGVPFAIALGLVVAILDLIPLAGSDDRRDHRQHRGVPALDPGGDRRGDLLHRLPAAREPHPPAAHLRTDRAAVAARGADLRSDRRADSPVCSAPSARSRLRAGSRSS